MVFYFEKSDKLTIVNNVPHRGECFSVSETKGNILVSVFSENGLNESYCPPLFAVISVYNGVVSVFGALRLIKWTDSAYDVIPLISEVNYYKQPRAILQETLTAGMKHTVTLAEDNTKKLLLECAERFAVFDVPKDIKNPKLKLSPTTSGFLTVLSADTPKGKFLMTVLFDGRYRLLFSAPADTFDFTESSFTATTHLNDMLGRVAKRTYSFTDGEVKLLDTFFSYDNDKIYPDDLTPYLFLEALTANDLQRAETYLAPEMRGYLEKCKDYFGAFVEIKCPKYVNIPSTKGLTAVALLYNDTSSIVMPRIFKFELKSGLIYNISD
jgi:hypothetical protein